MNEPTDEKFSWSKDNDAVVVHGQDAIAIYENPQGQIVIRQEGDQLGNDDHFVVIDRRFLREFIKELQAAAKAK